MVPILLFIIIAVDLALVYAFVRLSRRQEANQAIMKELFEERIMLTDMRNAARDEFTQAQNQMRHLKDQVQILAAEAEQEVKGGVAAIASEVDAIISTLGARFEGPLAELNAKQHYIENLLQRVQTERKNITQTTERVGAIAKLFKEGANAETILRELEDKKFDDIRSMLARGTPAARISKELGVTEQEVKLVAALR